MDPKVKEALIKAQAQEPFARQLGLELFDLDDGYAVVEMTYEPEIMDNIYNKAHGGAIFSLIDEAFQMACQTDGTVNVALNVSVTYVSTPKPGDRLRAEAREVSRTKKTLNFDIRIPEKGRHPGLKGLAD